MTAAQESNASRDALMTTELVPEQILPKVLGTFGLTATYVFIICWISGSSVMATGGWQAIPFWILGVIFFLLPAGLAVAELGNLWPGQGGVYIWAYRTMNENLAFVGGFLSWVPVILNGASGPATVLQLLLLAFHASLGTTVSVILQLVILWGVVGMALAKLAASQKVMNAVFIIYGVLTTVIFIAGIIYASRHGGPATPFHGSDLVKPNFAVSGFLFGTVLLYLVGVETPFNMGAEFLSVRKSATRMILWGSVALMVIYLLTTIGTMLVLPTAKIDSVTGVIDNLDTSGFPGLMEIAAVTMAVIVFVALATYAIAYSRLIFVSGLERHLPRIFTHLNPRTRNPVTAILIQASISSVMIVGLFSQGSLEHVTIYLTGSLSVIWLASGLFFFIPPLIARVKYADRYESEDFWRIPGGKPVVWLVCLVGIVGTLAGIYYSYAEPWTDVSKGTWMTWLSVIIVVTLVVMAVVYIFGRRSAAKLTETDALAQFAKFDLDGEAPDAV
ncbi:APC family permease [Nocardioides sp. KR10-350]|uniref:APC family permease n=1 Tax=Nocardioides cheoyonin TaxID=3156615 RepID=UPI0032B42A93